MLTNAQWDLIATACRARIASLVGRSVHHMSIDTRQFIAGQDLIAVTSVDYGRHMVEVVRTDDFDQWLRKLKDRVGRLRIVERLDRLTAGHPGDAKPVGRGVWELRLMFGPGYRVYYLPDGPRAILLLCGGDKATQQRDIKRALQLAEDYRKQEVQDHE